MDDDTEACAIRKLKRTLAGEVIAECESASDVSKIRKTINNLQDKYIANILEKYRPRIIVNGIEFIEDITHEKLEIIMQNELAKHDSFYLKVIIKLYNKKFEDTSRVIEVDAKILNFLGKRTVIN
ncbi:hypothetical protein WA026_021751 [Henosepilachna vigintioctopunctata]|uniref:Uncharacterized protein n=1 Tax=Henosepilachna vigintioctopunctata TaxID=420089 RepID=A0AAW1TY26_9CUCU